MNLVKISIQNGRIGERDEMCPLFKIVNKYTKFGKQVNWLNNITYETYEPAFTETHEIDY